MNTLVMNSRVGSDGVLHLALPPEAAGREVRVTIVEARPTMTPEEWRAWVQSMAGSWQGEFERPPQLPLEEREPLS